MWPWCFVIDQKNHAFIMALRLFIFGHDSFFIRNVQQRIAALAEAEKMLCFTSQWTFPHELTRSAHSDKLATMEVAASHRVEIS